MALASLIYTMPACDDPEPAHQTTAGVGERPAELASTSPSQFQVTVTLPHPAGERASPSEELQQATNRAIFESEVERRIAERAGDAQALATVKAEGAAREADTATEADAVLRAVLPLIEQCPGAAKLGELSVLLDTFGLFDVWVLVDERTELPEPFLMCAGSVVWTQDWPSSDSLRRFSISRLR